MPRVWLVFVGMAGVGAAMVLLRFPPSQFGFYPACPILEWTGLLCPGCGGTRAVAALLRGHWAEAWRLNGLVVGLMPLGLLYAGVTARRVWRGDLRGVGLPRVVWAGLVVVSCGFTVWRNLG